MKLRTKIFLLILLIALPPLILITFLAYTRYVSTTYDRMDEISENMFHNAVSTLNDRLNSIDQSAGLFTFYADSEFTIVDVLEDFSDPSKQHDNLEVLKANNKIKFVCQNVFYSYPYIYGLYVFTPSGATLGHTTGNDGDLLYRYDPSKENWYQQTQALKGKLYISSVADQPMFSGHKQSLFFSKALYDVYTHRFLGILLIDCDPSLFDLSKVNTMPDITLFQLKDTDNDNVLYTNASSVRSDFSGSSLVTRKDTLSMDALTLTASFDYDALFREYSFTGVLLIVMALICGIATVLVSLLISRNITYPIEHLSRKMARQNGSHLTTSSKCLNRPDEIGTLYNEYNAMVEELNLSIKKDYQDKLITMDAQMRSLEAQINSHFLFNTLESINSLAEIDEDERISTMVMALGSMFRYSIKTQSELVTVEEELAHVRNYIAIQSIRYDGKFRMVYEIPDPIKSMRVLKLILQPLVENALSHGLCHCTCGDTVRVFGQLTDGFLTLGVSDNGIGMQPEELSLLRSRLQETSNINELGHRTSQSIGLKNIHSRIELYYGKGYGLRIQSAPGEGSTISILLPLLTPETES